MNRKSVEKLEEELHNSFRAIAFCNSPTKTHLLADDMKYVFKIPVTLTTGLVKT